MSPVQISSNLRGTQGFALFAHILLVVLDPCDFISGTTYNLTFCCYTYMIVRNKSNQGGIITVFRNVFERTFSVIWSKDGWCSQILLLDMSSHGLLPQEQLHDARRTKTFIREQKTWSEYIMKATCSLICACFCG